MREGAQRLGISLVHAPLGNTINEAEYRRIFKSIQRDQVDGIIVSEESENYTNRFLLVQLVQQIRVPAIFSYRDQAVAGGTNVVFVGYQRCGSKERTLKMRMGATHFLMKTLPKVASEMALSVLAYNLTRVINIVGTTALMAAIRA